MDLFSYICIICSVRLTVRTPPFHGGDTGSIPVPSTKHTSQSVKPHLAVSVCSDKRRRRLGRSLIIKGLLRIVVDCTWLVIRTRKGTLVRIRQKAQLTYWGVWQPVHDMDGADKDELGKRIVGEVGYHATLSRWSSRVRVPYSPQVVSYT